MQVLINFEIIIFWKIEDLEDQTFLEFQNIESQIDLQLQPPKYRISRNSKFLTCIREKASKEEILEIVFTIFIDIQISIPQNTFLRNLVWTKLKRLKLFFTVKIKKYKKIIKFSLYIFFFPLYLLRKRKEKKNKDSNPKIITD